MSDFVDPGRQYRRGVILGLSLAELFTILVFLLLLVLGAYALMQDEALKVQDEVLKVQDEALQNSTTQFDEEKARADDLRDVLTAKAAREGNPIKPGLPGDLVIVSGNDLTPEEAAKKIEQQKSAIDKLAQQLALIERTKLGFGPAIEPKDDLTPEEAAEKIEQQKSAIDELVQQLAAIGRANEELRSQSGKPAKDTKLQLAKQAKEIERLQAHNATLRTRVKELEIAENGAAGQDSPCWFTHDLRSNGEPYEKSVYIFDVRITDEHLFVQDIPAPTDHYSRQKPTLPFDRSALNRPLADPEFVNAFRPLREAGHNGDVRDRRCTFHVRVWDDTGETNKLRYKRAHNEVIETVFITFESRDPWPHG